MDGDPWFEIKAYVLFTTLLTLLTPRFVHSEVETGLSTLSSLASSFARLSRSSLPDSTSEELQWAVSELRATLAAIEPDLEELEESVSAVEEQGVRTRLGLSEKEVRGRRDFVERAKGEVQVRLLPPVPRQGCGFVGKWGGTLTSLSLCNRPFDDNCHQQQARHQCAFNPLFSPFTRTHFLFPQNDARKRLPANSSYPPSYRTHGDDDREDKEGDPNEEFEQQHQTVRRTFPSLLSSRMQP
jgi:hypothetical protein